MLIFARSRSFVGLNPWIGALSQFEWGWSTIYLLDEGAESEAENLIMSLYAKTGNGRVVPAREFRDLHGEILETTDFWWRVEAPVKQSIAPPKGVFWVSRDGAVIADQIAPECFAFLCTEGLFKATDQYWTHGMTAWAPIACLR